MAALQGVVDKAQIFVIRKVNKLMGEDQNDSSPNAVVFGPLEQYFGSFLPPGGSSVRIILLPSRRRCGRLRPSSTGFVHLPDAQAVARIVETGIHAIGEYQVECTAFDWPSFEKRAAASSESCSPPRFFQHKEKL
jgi:hypothetical protein